MQTCTRISGMTGGHERREDGKPSADKVGIG